jgi:subtilisin family serine protease
MDQYDGYCYSNKSTSYDGFGHGSHIAGIIWNKLKDQDTGVYLGIAPDAKILSVRVLGEDGSGTYADVIEGIQYVVANKYTYNIRVMNMSLSAYATTPYFEDPLNRAVEAAWANDIVVVVAAGNTGPGSESITVPGNDPYVITVGAVGNPRTPGYWGDDYLTNWTATGPI